MKTYEAMFQEVKIKLADAVILIGCVLASVFFLPMSIIMMYKFRNLDFIYNEDFTAMDMFAKIGNMLHHNPGARYVESTLHSVIAICLYFILPAGWVALAISAVYMLTAIISLVLTEQVLYHINHSLDKDLVMECERIVFQKAWYDEHRN